MCNLDLIHQLSLYGAYHQNKYNQIIHLVFVPIIWWSSAVFLCYIPVPDAVTFGDAVYPYLIANYAFVLFVLYALLYCTLHFTVALQFNAILFGLYVLANLTYVHVELAWLLALVLHITGWVVQIVPGHMMAEGRKPALLNNLFQAFALAPLFVYFELLFSLGFYKDLQESLKEKIGEMELPEQKFYCRGSDDQLLA